MAALLFRTIGPEPPHQKRSEFGSVPEFAAMFQMHRRSSSRWRLCHSLPKSGNLRHAGEIPISSRKLLLSRQKSAAEPVIAYAHIACMTKIHRFGAVLGYDVALGAVVTSGTRCA
jgi:hypothetical protein